MENVPQKCINFISDFLAELIYAIVKFVGENSEPLMFRLEDGVFSISVPTMKMFHGNPLMRRVSEIFDRLFEADIYSH
jgi:hypothetical protein